MVNFCKLILLHVKEYCEQAAIHGPQHIVSERLSRLERLETMTIREEGDQNEICSALFLQRYYSNGQANV